MRKISRRAFMCQTGVLTMGLLAGCASGNSGSAASGSASSASASGAASAEEESGSITLGIWPEDTQTEAIAVHENT